MRLLECTADGDLSLTKDLFKDIPPYAILSHTWGDDDQEITYKEVMDGSGKSKAGYRKIQFCGEQARRDSLEYIWVDTCCINKGDPVELQKSINSMFLWYKNAVKCYVYLADVSMPGDEDASECKIAIESKFRTAKWFTRGWTLQELLAPSSVDFFSTDYRWIGDKFSLERLIHERTGIPVEALRRYDPKKFSLDERVAWTAKRETKHEEDMAYSLLGMCNIFLPLIYGEGRENAFRRLREEVGRSVEGNGVDKLDDLAAKKEPKFTVPFVRDPKFIGRVDVIQEMTKQLDTRRRIAICGIGGIGKSQIAIEYCYIWKHRYPESHVFWIHTSSFDQFEQAYREIAKQMSIPGTEDPQSDTLVLVRDWLNTLENGSWLLILDNADDIDLFFELDSTANKPNHPYIGNLLPRNENCFMITTTRDKRIGQRLSDQEEEITIDVLPPKDAEQLLVSKIPRSEDTSSADFHCLNEILGNIPLAITQAAAFIRENSMTVESYIKELEASDSDLQDYMDESLPDPRRYPDSENSVARTWKLSFDQIAKQFPGAADLLSLTVQLDRQAIPKTLLSHIEYRSIDFNKALGTLQAYSFIRAEKGGSSFEIHRLVQLSTLRWLSLRHKKTEWQERSLELMAKTFPHGYYGTWEECETLYLHAKSVAKHEYAHKAVRVQQAELLENLATYDYNQGRSEAAYRQSNNALMIRESELGEKHLDALTTVNSLAWMYESDGNLAESEIQFRRTSKTFLEVLGNTHPETLWTTNKLAKVLSMQGNFAEAETMVRQNLEISRIELGNKHETTIETATALAFVLLNQDKNAEAEPIIRNSLQLCEEVFGEKHPSTLECKGNLAFALSGQEKYAEAELMFRHTVEVSREILGNTHRGTLDAINRLCWVIISQKFDAEVEHLLRQNIQTCECMLGKTHQVTINGVYYLAWLFEKKEEYEEALTLYERACAGFESIYGSQHSSTLECKRRYSAMLDISSTSQMNVPAEISEMGTNNGVISTSKRRSRFSKLLPWRSHQKPSSHG
ncbi:P-loop containing nucleoside triphosphate hydrolase [Glarea lozoyensis ATCC 20868]|uniref:p-loop containing nucleoside triphosphate hydrolase n=1 Tax=Glarea lozoyensis (strain ATCC 20868 / MF5171) TaxID=1116229 RepID=S3DDE2_GLAL2|nr:P-loop containing nucleoside triphosphate hydrolase [Glarea lozoyensis ATCC 20868]EPE36432.1 P-loop containing nucleoside triphosphate hydrolase [Glarea lozoyensis ATCC 20868]